jgi:hypothetical protein
VDSSLDEVHDIHIINLQVTVVRTSVISSPSPNMASPPSYEERSAPPPYRAGQTNDKLLLEVRALAGNVEKVDEAFERVRVGLAELDGRNYRDRNGLIRKFEQTWVGFQKACRDQIV